MVVLGGVGVLMSEVPLYADVARADRSQQGHASKDENALWPRPQSGIPLEPLIILLVDVTV